MSFSRESKLEILQQEPETDDEVLAFLSGLFHSCGEVSRNGKKFSFKLVTDLKELFDYLNKILSRVFTGKAEISSSEDYLINKNPHYEIIFDVDKFRTLLLDIGVLEISEGGMSLNLKINENLLLEDGGRRAFIKGAYIGCATSSIKISEGAQSAGSGYHMEFISQSHDFLLSLSELLAQFSIIGKIFERKGSFVLYIKDAQTIQDLLALVGANNAVLTLSSEIVTRELRNKVNRQVNCATANINKTVEASMKQTAAIRTIEETIGLDRLTPDLQEVALLRLANPEESLDELLKLSTIPLTRSGLNHRFRKIIKIAENLGSDDG